MALTRIELDQAGCDMADCQHDHSILYLHAGCHLKGGVEVIYTKATGALTISCAKCHKFVAEIAVATMPDATRSSH